MPKLKINNDYKTVSEWSKEDLAAGIEWGRKLHFDPATHYTEILVKSEERIEIGNEK